MCGMARGRCQTHSRLANCTLIDCFHLLYVYLTSSVRVSFYQMVSCTQLKWISGSWVACTDKLLVSLPKQFPAISWSTSFSLKEARLMPSLPTPLYLMYVFRVVTSSICCMHVYLTSSVRVSFYQMVSCAQLKWISGGWVACTDKLLVSLPKQFPAISWSTSFSLKEARLMPSLPTPLYLMYVFRVVTSSIWLRKKKL